MLQSEVVHNVLLHSVYKINLNAFYNNDLQVCVSLTIVKLYIVFHVKIKINKITVAFKLLMSVHIL